MQNAKFKDLTPKTCALTHIIRMIPFHKDSKIIVLSDCHRGNGSAGDEFARNSLIYKCALEYYLEHGFTYIELGDAEELWENDDFEQIYITHTSVYDLLRRFHDPDPAKTRYLKVLGNHDEDWRDNPAPLRSLFPDIQLHDTLEICEPEKRGTDSFSSEEKKGALPVFSILLLHGHQADPSCSGAGARISRFLVRKVWSGLQKFGIGDPTRAAENPGRCDKIDETLYRMAKGKIIVAGHTHRPVFANLSLTERRCLESGIGPPGVRRKEKADPVYYNTGSCVHPRCITGIEITAEARQNDTEGSLRPRFTLVKWGFYAEAACTQPAAGAVTGATAGDPRFPLSIRRTVLEIG